MVLNEAQEKEMKSIVSFFMECVGPISDPDERSTVTVKILSHLGCFTDRLTGHLNKNQEWREL